MGDRDMIGYVKLKWYMIQRGGRGTTRTARGNAAKEPLFMQEWEKNLFLLLQWLSLSIQFRTRDSAGNLQERETEGNELMYARIFFVQSKTPGRKNPRGFSSLKYSSEYLYGVNSMYSSIREMKWKHTCEYSQYSHSWCNQGSPASYISFWQTKFAKIC